MQNHRELLELSTTTTPDDKKASEFGDGGGRGGGRGEGEGGGGKYPP